MAQYLAIVPFVAWCFFCTALFDVLAYSNEKTEDHSLKYWTINNLTLALCVLAIATIIILEVNGLAN